MIAASIDTRRAWSDDLNAKERARTLAATRFITFRDEEIGDEWRQQSCLAIQDGAVIPEKIRSMRHFLARLMEGASRVLYGSLQSRLILNASGSAMENGGLCLDRNSGIPYIPASAVKGCARRSAIAALQGATPADKTALLEKVALVFGWTGEDWKSGRKPVRKSNRPEFHSDFCFACSAEPDDPRFQQICAELTTRLAARLDFEPTNKVKTLENLPNFAGTVNFFNAFPIERDPGIDLDIITCHHQKYYDRKPGHEDAPDIEEPKPIIFPAISPKSTPIFAFFLQVNPRGVFSFADGTTPTEMAEQWLKSGLGDFGIGGKTSAGYGWFECSSAVQSEARRIVADANEAENRAAIKRREKEKQDLDDVAEKEAIRIRNLAIAGMNSEQILDYDIDHLKDSQFADKLRRFAELGLDDKAAVVRSLRDPNRRGLEWDKIKTRCNQGTQKERRTWSPIAEAIRAYAKAVQIKMP